jgi:hypothetical protein
MTNLTKEQIALINKPLPAEAIKDHPSKVGMSTIKAIFVTDRLNEVFGVGGWQIRTREVSMEKIESVTKAGKDRTTYMCVTHTTFSVPECSIYYECIAGSSNDDCGDAYKGSTTDAITKVGSYLGIGADIWRGVESVPTEFTTDLSAVKSVAELSAVKTKYTNLLSNKSVVKLLTEKYNEVK